MTPGREVHESMNDVLECEHCEMILDGYDEIVENRVSRVERLISEQAIAKEGDLLRRSARKYMHHIDLKDAIERLEETGLSTIMREELVDPTDLTINKNVRFTELLKSTDIDRKYFSIHLKELVRHGFLEKEDRAYHRGDEYLLTYFNIIRYLKHVNPARMRWFGGIGYFQIDHVPSDKDLERLHLKVMDCCREVGRIWKKAMKEEPYSTQGVLIPKMIVVDVSSVHEVSGDTVSEEV